MCACKHVSIHSERNSTRLLAFRSLRLRGRRGGAENERARERFCVSVYVSMYTHVTRERGSSYIYMCMAAFMMWDLRDATGTRLESNQRDRSSPLRSRYEYNYATVVSTSAIPCAVVVTHIPNHILIHVFTHTHTHTHTHAHTYTYTYAHTHKYTHTYTHKHTRTKYGVASISRLLRIVGLFYKRAL